jgi:catechol 2,3-dioxygenase-like lactoylglutathione lyase family enzyme
MVRSALFVADLERSTSFYRDLLGLAETWYAGELSDGNAHELLGMPAGSVTKARILKAEGPAWGMVGLFEISNPAPPKQSGDASRINQGETCLVFYSSKLDRVMQQLEAGGHHVLCAPLMLTVDGKARQREMTFRDPDGVLINLIEWNRDDAMRPEQK